MALKRINKELADLGRYVTPSISRFLIHGVDLLQRLSWLGRLM